MTVKELRQKLLDLSSKYDDSEVRMVTEGSYSCITTMRVEDDDIGGIILLED